VTTINLTANSARHSKSRPATCVLDQLVRESFITILEPMHFESIMTTDATVFFHNLANKKKQACKQTNKQRNRQTNWRLKTIPRRRGDNKINDYNFSKVVDSIY